MFNPNSFLKTLKSQFQNPKFHLPISFAQNRSVYNSAIQFILNEAEESQSSKTQRNYPAPKEEEEFPSHKQHDAPSSIQISHPWPEWVDLMEKLFKNGYFGEIGNPYASNGQVGSKEANLIRTACLNFARDQYQLIRYLSRKDVLVIAESGCPSTDRKVVNSGKRLRAHLGINEGNVCSSCVLRGDCDRAYVKARENEGGRTVDVMRFLLTYGLDPVVGSVENKPCLNRRVKESVRTLLKEMVETRVEENGDELSKATALESTVENDVDRESSQTNVPMKQGDWICPKCNFNNFARNVKCLRCDCIVVERLKKISEEYKDLPLKKGDWRCDKCEFLNFARNTRCLLCKAKPPKRQLNPGEWECDSCNYINFSRNMVCLKCDHRRPIASHSTDNSANVHQTQPQERRSESEHDDSWKFVEGDSEDHVSSRSWNQGPGFMDFPVLGGKSDVSQDSHKQEFWKMKMADNKRRPAPRPREDTTGRHNSYIFQRASECPASGDDDDMAEWFRSRKKL